MSISTFSLRLLAFFTFTSDVKRTVGVRHESSISVQILEAGALLGNETDSTNHSEQVTGKTFEACAHVEGAETSTDGNVQTCRCIGYSQSVYCMGQKLVQGRNFDVKTLAEKGCDAGAYCSADALVVIDVQHCFTDGHTTKKRWKYFSRYKRVDSGRGKEDIKGLQNARGHKQWKEGVVAYVKKWVNRGHKIVVFQDFHDNNHVSFLKGNGNETTWDPANNLKKRTMDLDTYWHSNTDVGDVQKKGILSSPFPLEYTAPVFPRHCVRNREESKLVDGLCEAVGGRYKVSECTVDAENVKVVQKGTQKNIDSFGGIYDNRMYIKELDSLQDSSLAKRASWGVLEWLNDHNVESAEAIGIADDYCVKITALDLADKEKAQKINRKAISRVEVNPQYTYGIMANLWKTEENGYGDTKTYTALKEALEEGGVKVRDQQFQIKA